MRGETGSGRLGWWVGCKAGRHDRVCRVGAAAGNESGRPAAGIGKRWVGREGDRVGGLLGGRKAVWLAGWLARLVT